MVAGGSSFNSIPHLFKRCVKCPTTPPSCPSCASGETCQLVSQSCDACASTKCVQIGSLPGQLASKPKTPIAPIIGGVIAGVVVIALIVFLVWRFVIRPRRKAMQQWDPPEKRDQSTLMAGDRHSTRSAHSLASTVMTRASNVIPIAYIPGVTVRSPPDSPGLLAPPMPLMSGSGNSSAMSSPAVEQHFFMPGDLRDSTWSDTSDPRISIAPSLARSTVYGEAEAQEIPPIPVQHAFRAQANMVSVRPGSATPSGSSKTPSTPQFTKMGNSSIVARNVVARPVEIKKAGSGPRVPTLANLAKQADKKAGSTSASEKSVPVFFEEKEVFTPTSGAPDSPIIHPKPSFATMDSARSSSVSAIMPSEGPLGSGNSVAVHRHSKSDGLNAMIEEAINKARDTSVARPELKKHDSGPFSDSNEVKENLP